MMFKLFFDQEPSPAPCSLLERRPLRSMFSIQCSIFNVRPFACSLLAFLALLLLTPGCATIPRLPAADLKEPGWTVHEGQAVWKSKRGASEMAGEILVATRPDGTAFVQFTKTPFPFIIARATTNSWQI